MDKSPWPSMLGFLPTAGIMDEKTTSMLHAASFEGLAAQSFYPTGRPWMTQDPAYVKWDPADQAQAASIYAFPFPEQYPSDPFPSVSSSLPNVTAEYKYPPSTVTAPSTTLNTVHTSPSTAMPYYAMPNPFMQNYANAIQPDYSQVFQNWKSSTVKPASKNTPHQPYRTGPGTNNVRVRTTDKYRNVYTEYQRVELEKVFISNPFVTSEMKADLSSQLNLTERQIKIWFQNRRAKDRRDAKK